MNMSLDLESRCKHENKKKKSKYLIYNENTKLLEVKADTKSKFQTFLAVSYTHLTLPTICSV